MRLAGNASQLPFLMGAIGMADTTGRYMVLVPAAQSAGYAIGPVLVGLVIVEATYSQASLISLVFFVLCLVLLVPIIRRMERAQ